MWLYEYSLTLIKYTLCHLRASQLIYENKQKNIMKQGQVWKEAFDWLICQIHTFTLILK